MYEVANPMARPAIHPITDTDVLATLFSIIGDHTMVAAVASAFTTWEELTAASRQELVWRVGTWAAALRLPARPYSLGALGAGVGACGRYSPDYPRALAALADAPVVLYRRGLWPVGPLLAVGGSHYPSDEGHAVAARAGEAAAAKNVVLVAALDSGCGHIALEAAVRAGGRALAVASADLAAPGINDGLIRRILEQGGGVVSEWGPGTAWCETRVTQYAPRLVAAVASVVVLAELGSNFAGGASLARAAIANDRRLIVPDGTAPELAPVSALATASLTSPRRFNEKLFGTSRHVADRLAMGMAPADVVLHRPEDIDGLVGALARSWRRARR